MNTFNIKKFLYTYLFIGIAVFCCFMIFRNVNMMSGGGIVVTTFICNGMVIFYQLCKSSKLGYSLKDIVFLFLFIFMFMSPLIQYVEHSFPWGNTNLFTDENIIYANFIVMLFMLVYVFVYKVSFIKNKDSNELKCRQIRNIKIVIDIFFWATVFCSIYIIRRTGFINLFARFTSDLQIEKSSFREIVKYTFRSVSVLYVALNLLYIAKNKRVYRKIPLILGVILMIVVNFPTGTARFWMAAVYLGILIILKRKMENPHLFKMIILAGILVVFSAVNMFRNLTFQEVIINGIDVPRVFEAFVSGDFDSYSMLIRAIIYVDFHGITWGNQLLGTFLFFIPRQIWPTKPIGSGAFLATDFGWNFINVSCPFIGEGYINFGILGVVVFAILLSLICKFADKLYEKTLKSVNCISFIELIYPFSLGFLFFILRGDLLSTFSLYIGFMCPIILLWLNRLFKL